MARWHAIGSSLDVLSLVTVWVVLTAAVWPALGQTATPPSASPLPSAPPELLLPTPEPPGATARDPNGIRDGVLLPPAGADPGIRPLVSPPALGTTPVIPPPGTPGGNPTVQP